MLVIGQCNRTKGQLTRHAGVSGQNASCARAVVSHFAKFIVVVVFFNEKVSPMSAFFLIFCHSYD